MEAQKRRMVNRGFRNDWIFTVVPVSSRIKWECAEWPPGKSNTRETHHAMSARVSLPGKKQRQARL